jgi:YidC/Oxa1 family membrane protein insertase
MERRLIAAIIASIAVIVVFQYAFVKPQPGGKMEAVVPVPSPAPPPPTEPVAADTAAEGEKEFTVETARYILTFSNIGGAIKRIELKDYKTALRDSALTLVDLKNPKEYIFSASDNLMRINFNKNPYEIKEKDGAVICSGRQDDFDVVKRYVFPKDKRAIELQLFIKNISPSPKDISYVIVGGAGLKEAHPADERLIEVTSKIDGRQIGFKRPKDRLIIPGSVNWVAAKNKYFSVVLKPFVTTKAQFSALGKDGALYSGVETQDTTIPAGSFIENKFLLYVGPSHIPALREAGYELEETVNYGFFGAITKGLLVVMHLFYSIVRSWGVSIILLAIFLNIILFPLTAKSFKSMQKMQALHPQMEKLKAQCKDNPQKLNREMMELYRKYKINPFGGCLPLLLQMPIFFALYQALMKSIELRGASFLWIKDLSSPDAVKIPFSLPLLGQSINILPIVMVIATIIQQKISTKSMGSAVTPEQQQQQRMMLFMMPIMFGFIFYNMPSGLVLYWLINTVLTVIEQFAIFKPLTLTNEA